MTKEEAVKMLEAKLECMARNVSGIDYDCNRRLCRECHLNYDQGNMGEQKEYLRMSIEALKQKPCEDSISRQEVMNALCDGCELFKNGEQTCRSKCEEYHFLATLPPVTQQPKTGHWIRFKEFENGYYHIKCSECGQYWSVDGHAKIFRYCFNCGAKMEEVEEA